jgi:hypothetical protein
MANPLRPRTPPRLRLRQGRVRFLDNVTALTARRRCRWPATDSVAVGARLWDRSVGAQAAAARRLLHCVAALRVRADLWRGPVAFSRRPPRRPGPGVVEEKEDSHEA